MLLQVFSYAAAIVCALHGDLIGPQRFRVGTGEPGVQAEMRVELVSMVFMMCLTPHPVCRGFWREEKYLISQKNVELCRFFGDDEETGEGRE